jgi:hypothetical protein
MMKTARYAAMAITVRPLSTTLCGEQASKFDQDFVEAAPKDDHNLTGISR